MKFLYADQGNAVNGKRYAIIVVKYSDVETATVYFTDSETIAEKFFELMRSRLDIYSVELDDEDDCLDYHQKRKEIKDLATYEKACKMYSELDYAPIPYSIEQMKACVM